MFRLVGRDVAGALIVGDGYLDRGAAEPVGPRKIGELLDNAGGYVIGAEAASSPVFSGRSP